MTTRQRPGVADRLFQISLLAAASTIAACGGGGNGNNGVYPVLPPPAATEALEIRTASTRADMVSGGDALIEIVMPKDAGTAGLKVDVGGRDVSSAFAVRADGRLTGLVTGLAKGENVVTAQADRARAARLVVTNADRGGPVISGPQVTPFVCATPTPQGATANSPATNGSGLSTSATDAQCNIAAETQLYYRSNVANCNSALPDPVDNVAFNATAPFPVPAPPLPNPCFKRYDPNAAAPSDMATATTDTGLKVPFVVRVERGTLNRGIYDLAVLVDPTKPVAATSPQAQWNGKVYYQFGASTGQPRRQIRPATAWTTASAQLGLGYMVAANSMTDSAINSNRVLMAETVMMMKEHIGDRYGAIKFTMGTGCSGGSINSNMNASIAPGQLDGFTIACAYPDSETVTLEVNDCVLLTEAYQKPEWAALMTSGGYAAEQVNGKKAAINGHPDQTGCHGWYNAFGSNGKAGNYVPRLVVDKVSGALANVGALTNNCQLPTSQVFDPVSNPNGARCSAWDWAAPIWGKAANGQRALDTRDNTGVQYGLQALLSNAITGEEFVTLNEIIGGVDKNSNLQAARSVADTEALSTAYRSGIVLSGRQLAKTAVIDMRGWDDSSLITQPGTAAPSTIPIHYVWRSFSIRDRLDREFGDHGNQVLWRFGRGGLTSPVLAPQAFTTMDRWLTTLKADTGSDTIESKVRKSKPADAVDFCLLSSDVAQSTRVTDTAVCDADPFLKPSSSPRRVAGGPLSENVLKCQLRPIDAAQYGGRIDATQLGRLNAVFPGGVCDWTKPGVGQQPAVGPLTFQGGPGGQPLPAAPTSKPV
ncbi:MAG: hypothetical protein EOO24_06395 [Comamonadaceae bacterium]|nr:MAG: hypothetical protein EOO24_06395 [Comamonadaceae bacterium]